MHSLIVTSRDIAIVWYGGSTFHVHSIVFGEILPHESDVVTSYGEEGNPPTLEQAVRFMKGYVEA